jgi:hypothetical protein
MFTKSLICSLLAVSVFASVAPVQATTIKYKSPTIMTNYSKCRDKELWKTRKADNEICTKQSGKYQWEPALTNSDVYQVSDFCAKVINADQCEWTERVGLALVRGKGPRDSCVKLLRAVVYAVSKANTTNIDPNNLAGKAITDNKKFCYDEDLFPN